MINIKDYWQRMCLSSLRYIVRWPRIVQGKAIKQCYISLLCQSLRKWISFDMAWIFFGTPLRAKTLDGAWTTNFYPRSVHVMFPPPMMLFLSIFIAKAQFCLLNIINWQLFRHIFISLLRNQFISLVESFSNIQNTPGCLWSNENRCW